MGLREIHTFVQDFLKSHTMTLKNFSAIFALRMIQKILALASTYFLVRALTQEQFGEYSLIVSASGICTIFALRGLNMAIVQSVARGHLGTLRAAVPLAMVWGILGSAVLALMAAWFIHVRQDMEMGVGFLAATVLFPVARALDQWKHFYGGQDRFDIILKSDGVFLTILHAAIITVVLVWPGEMVYPLVLYFLVPAVQNAVMTALLYKKTADADHTVEQDSISYGIKTSFYSALSIASNHIDKLLLFFFLSPASLAIYVAADRVAEFTNNLIQDISAALAPRFARQKKYTKKLDEALKLFSLITGIMIVIFAFTALPWFLIFVFGEDYRDSVPYSQALLCAVAVRNIATLRFRYIRSQLDGESFREVTIWTAVVRIASSFILIPLLGLLGAVISVFIYRFATSVAVEWSMRKRYGLEKQT